MKLIKNIGKRKGMPFGLYECPECGCEYEANKYNVNRGYSTKCRPCGYKSSTTKNSKRGRKSKLYPVWQAMKQRCSNPKDKNFHHYGGRGISVCDEWSDYEVFYDWALSSGYKNKLTLERTDNDKGYSPSNCEWATQQVQTINQRMSKTNTSGYIGVHPQAKDNIFIAAVRYNGKRHYIGCYKDKVEAARERDAFILNNKFPHPLNFKYFNE